MINQILVTFYPKEDRPSVQWNHVNGPLLNLVDGTIHWLTLLERFLLWTNNATLDEIQEKHICGTYIPWDNEYVMTAWVNEKDIRNWSGYQWPRR